MNAKPKQQFGKWIGLMLIAGILIIAAGGCISIKSKTDVKLDGDGNRKHSKKHRRKLDKSDAYVIAKSLARDAGANPRDYDIHDKKIDGVYWVLFERYDQRKDRGWKNHFSVRVSPSGRGKLYRE